MPEIVNVVAAGKLGREMDIPAITEDIDAAVVKLSDESYSHRVVYLRRDEGGPMATLFRSGSYHITGADSTEGAEELKDWMVAALEDLGIEVTATFAIKNVVLTGDLEEQVNLNTLVTALGLEKTEYEPEQFPGVVYRPPDIDCVFLIFGSGKVVITGSPDVETAVEGFQKVTERLKQTVG
ncbi:MULTISPECIES: TATA-box-binding protein [Halorussus]|uniref:TATA-box-binding protein n=1 Tax=Halorussus TaxID=1070314 RepID=UPI000E20CE32|nr:MULTISPECIES: TATA-box-binding protein [Halorussus]NHN60455.1 TATA-box-binding protein [Halorussus sp. JP-T4]